MSIGVKTKNHQGDLRDKADESDPKMFITGMSNCPVKYFKKFLSILNPNQIALFQKPKRNFLPSDEIWFENSRIGVNKVGGMMKEVSLSASLSKVYTNHCVRSTIVSALDEAEINPFIKLCRLQATEARVALSRIVTDKAWKSTKNPPIFLLESVMIPPRRSLRPAQ